MGFFSFKQELAIDLGTANTIIVKDGKIVLDEPSVISFDGNGKVIGGQCGVREWRPLGHHTAEYDQPVR